MKNLSLLLGIALLFLLEACSTPTDYNTSIMNEVDKVEKSALNIEKRLEEKNFEAAQTAFQEGKDQTKASLKKLEGMSAFRGDDLFRQAAVNFVVFYDGLFTNEYQKAFDLLKKGGTYTMEEADVEIMDAISQQEMEVKQHLVNEQIAFVKKYDLIW